MTEAAASRSPSLGSHRWRRSQKGKRWHRWWPRLPPLSFAVRFIIVGDAWHLFVRAPASSPVWGRCTSGCSPWRVPRWTFNCWSQEQTPTPRLHSSCSPPSAWILQSLTFHWTSSWLHRSGHQQFPILIWKFPAYLYSNDVTSHPQYPSFVSVLYRPNWGLCPSPDQVQAHRNHVQTVQCIILLMWLELIQRCRTCRP